MKNLIDICLYLLLQYIFITFVLMYIFQGGSMLQPDETYYIMNENYLSDLGRTFLFDNDFNPFWMFYTFTLGLVGMGTFLFFYILSQFVDKKRHIPIILGTISGLAYMGIAFYQVNTHLKAHVLSGQIAYFAFYFALISLLFLLNKDSYPKLYKLILTLFIIITIYLFINLFGPKSFENKEALHLKTITQKITVYSQIIISIWILIIVKKNVKPEIN